MLKPRTEQEILADVKKKANSKGIKKLKVFGITAALLVTGFTYIVVKNDSAEKADTAQFNLEDNTDKTSTPVENIPVVEPKLAEEPETPYEQTDEMGGQPAELPQSSSVSVIKNPSTIEGYSQEDKEIGRAHV